MLNYTRWLKAGSIIALLALHAPAHALFFFVIPIPKGSANPDAMEATLPQRQSAMCAAYQINVIDPNLSGKRETSWRGQVADAARRQVAPYEKFTELRNRYIRQWQLQAKNSYQAGLDYSVMLNKSCVSAGLPQTEEQFGLWTEILPSLKIGQIASDYKSEAKIDNFEEVFALELLPKIKVNSSLQKSQLDLRVSGDGKVEYCEYNKISGNDILDNFACSQLRAVGKYTPAISDLSRVAAYLELEIDWPALYARKSAADRANGGASMPGGLVDYAPGPGSATGGVAHDTVMIFATQRCDVIEGKRGTPAYRSCLSKQIELISAK